MRDRYTLAHLLLIHLGYKIGRSKMVQTSVTGNDSEEQAQPASSGWVGLAPQAWISRFAEPLSKSANGPLAGHPRVYALG